MIPFSTKAWLANKGMVVSFVFLMISLLSLVAPTREEEVNASTPESFYVIEPYVLVKGQSASGRTRGNKHHREYRIRVKSETKDVMEECVVEIFRYWRIHSGDILTLYRRDDGTLIDPLSNVIPSSRWRYYAILILFFIFAFCLNRYLHYRPLVARARRDRNREIGAALIRNRPTTNTNT